MMQTGKSTATGMGRAWVSASLAVWLLLAAVPAYSAPLGAPEGAGPFSTEERPPSVLSLEEALAECSTALAALGEPGVEYVLGAARRTSLLEAYIVHMLRAHLELGGAAARRLHGVPPAAESGPPEVLSNALLRELRGAKGDLFVHAGSAIEGGQRYLVAAAYDLRTGRQRASMRTPFHLSEALTPLPSGQPGRMGAADRRWLGLLDEMVAPDGPTAPERVRQLELAEADYFFEAGLWEMAGPAFRDAAAASASPHFVRAIFALQLADEGKEAVSLLESSLKEHPDSGPLWALRSWLSLRQGRPDDALLWREQARLCDMAHEGLYCHARGLIGLDEGDDEAAREGLTRAAELLPQKLFAQLQLARFHRNRAELDEAIKCYRRAVATPNPTADTWGELAMALEAAGEIEEAIRALRRAFRMRSAGPVITRHLAALLKRQGRHEEGLEVLRRAAEANPRSAVLLAAYGDVAAGMWQVGTAEKAFEDAITADGDYPYARVRRAAMLARRRRYREARSLLTNLLATEPDYHLARIRLGLLLGELRQTEEALSVLQDAATDPQYEVRAHLALVEVHLGAGQVEQAVARAQIAASARPDAQTFAALSRAFLSTGDADKAETAANEALEQDPLDPRAHVALGRALQARGQPDEARKQADRAVELDPYCVDALELSGALWQEARDFRRCAESWQRALALNPWHADLHRRLSDMLGPRLRDWTGTHEHHSKYVELERMRAEAAP